ncbi:MAG TPA: OsmC family protein [Sphaerochaeta sp.]|nr:OsmC family protein [Sphaerochaeta sp.]
MADTKQIHAHFVPTKSYFVSEAGKEIPITRESDAYDLLFGALSACLFATFDALAKKMRATWATVDFVVDGQKRESSPTTLEWVTIQVSATGVEDEEKFLRAFETATRYCSIYTTISQVAKMTWSVDFS